MKLEVNIHKIKCIEDLTIELPVEKGLYAITGQNGSGKSTIAACASSVFFNMPMKEYFGKTDDDAFISFSLGDSTRIWFKEGKNTWKSESTGSMNIKGFFEGSLIFGNRFRDMSYDKIKKLAYINQEELIEGDDFIRKNLGVILQGDENFYEKLWVKSPDYANFKRAKFYYEKNGRRVSQFHMSTGENLLLSILYSLQLRTEDRASLKKPCMIFLDEIELALHPASLKRLITFLRDMSRTYNYAIYFSTHSIELISAISPSNIFFIERHSDNTIEVINPCYPAYATKNLYDQEGYDKVILVEDDLAKGIVDRILRDNKMLNSKLVHILPCGGYPQVIDLADSAVRFNLLGRKASISIILDGDVKDEAEGYINNKNIGNNIPLKFLPVESLEKFLRNKLVINVDHKLFRILDSYIFQQRSLTDIIGEYNKRGLMETDKNGKELYKIIDAEMSERRIERVELVKIIIDYLLETRNADLDKLIKFLQKQMAT